MIEHTLDTANSILYVQLKSPLEQDDFAQLATTADPHIEKTHFVSAEIKHFAAGEHEAAKQWITSRR
jgi:hypothetical protein